MSSSGLNESPPKEQYTPLGPPNGEDWDQGLSWGEGLVCT